MNELCLSNPPDVMSRYCTSAANEGSTHVAFGFLEGLCERGLCGDGRVELLAYLLEVVRDQPVPTFPMQTSSSPSRLPR